MNTIQSEWERYKIMIPTNATQIQIDETKTAFYAGASSVFHLMFVMSKKDVSEDASMKMMDTLWDEIKTYFEEIKKGQTNERISQVSDRG